GPPFHGKGLYDVLQAHHSMDAQPLNLARPEVPAELAALVAQMMAKEPERRFQEPVEVARALEPFFKGGASRGQGRGGESSPTAPPVLTASRSGSGPAVALGSALSATPPRPGAGSVAWQSLIALGEPEALATAPAPPREPAASPARRRRWIT